MDADTGAADTGAAVRACGGGAGVTGAESTVVRRVSRSAVRGVELDSDALCVAAAACGAARRRAAQRSAALCGTSSYSHQFTDARSMVTSWT